MNSRGTKEKKDIKALDEMIEQITVDAFGGYEPGGSILRATP